MTDDSEAFRKVVREIPLTREENPHGYGTAHLLDCGHVHWEVDHDPIRYDPGDEVYCTKCIKK